ncbi:MAG: hypothetical protein JF565_12350, partial [Propionibacteriales bacterium]|nr:hypothetical protein [Propionibacteriales bacterium]
SAKIIAVLACATSLLGTWPGAVQRGAADEGAPLMDRRRVLLVVAAIIAALGTLLVFLYVRGADDRANEKYHAVQVLKAVKQIEPGETVAAAQTAGKIQMSSIGEGEKLPDALTDLGALNGQLAKTTIYPGEQIIASKFGTTPATSNALTVPDGKIVVLASWPLSGARSVSASGSLSPTPMLPSWILPAVCAAATVSPGSICFTALRTCTAWYFSFARSSAPRT